MNRIFLPDDVLEFLEKIFKKCNLAVSRKISKMPNVHETSLDMTFIEQLSNYSVPVRLNSGWTVRLETHFLGGGRHFGSWEIADIGFLVMFRRAEQLVRSKVALLQSKRLYPVEEDFDEDELLCRLGGFGSLYESEETHLAASKLRKFTFKQASRYKALRKGDNQYERIEDFENNSGIPVHYMFYHPLRVPYSSNVPRTTARNPRRPNTVGCRIVRSESVRQALQNFSSQRVPCYGDLQFGLPEPYNSIEHEVGWRLEHFVAHLLVRCEEGYIAQDSNDVGLFTVFNERSGPISAAIGVTFDAPESPF